MKAIILYILQKYKFQLKIDFFPTSDDLSAYPLIFVTFTEYLLCKFEILIKFNKLSQLKHPKKMV